MMPTTFDQVLDAIEHLPAEEQHDLVEVVRRRLAEQGRRRVIDDVAAGEAEFAAGSAHPTTVDDLMREIEP